MLRDSVFDPVLSQFKADEEEVPYADDEPILGRKAIEDAFDETEDKFSNLLTATAWFETDRYLKKIDKGLDKADRNFVEKESWSIAIPMQNLLYSLWSESWNLGNNHATRELNIVYAKNIEQRKGEKGKEKKDESITRPSSSFHFPSSFETATFRKRDEPVFVAYPPDYGIPLESSDLKEAVQQRTLKLANDVSDQTAARIQGYIFDAVDKHKTDGGIPAKERKLLVRRINGILGRQRQEEAEKDIPPEERVKTTIAIPRTGAFHKRARTIATTELSAAYSLGRLQVYTQAGIKRVRWQAIGDLKTCKVCRSRNGTVHELDSLLAQHQFAYRNIYDPTQYIIPAHPNCKCHFSPLVENIDDDDAGKAADEGRSPALRQIAQLRRNWSLAGTAINAIRLATDVALRQRGATRERQRQEQAARTRRTIFLAGAAALSLAALYLLLRQGQQQRQQQGLEQPQNQPQPQAGLQPQEDRQAETVRQAAAQLQARQEQQERERQPVTAEEVMTEDLANRYPRLLQSGINLKAITNQNLQALYGVRPQDVQILRQLIQQYQQRQTIPPERALVPQNLLPQNILQQYPQLRNVPDVRNLTIEDIVRLGVPRSQATRLQQQILNTIRDRLALPPARIEGAGLMVGNLNLNAATPVQIAALLTRIPPQRRQAVANAIYEFLQRRNLAGQPVTDLNELRFVSGVGEITIRNLEARNFTTNLNNLLLQVGDEAAAGAIAGRLEIGPKLAAEIVKEFRQRGQFGRTGIDPVEDLIARLETRVNRPGSRLTLSEATKDRIRELLAGRVYVMPTPAVQPQVLTQGVGVQGEGEGEGEKGITVPSLTPVAQRPTTPGIPRTATSSAIIPTSPSPSPSPLVRRYQPSPPGSTGAQNLRHQENRDRIVRDTIAANEQFADYQSKLQAVVDNTQLPPALARKRRPPNLGMQLKIANRKQVEAVERVRAARVRINNTAAASGNVLPELESQVDDLEQLLQDINDPLAEPFFNNAGNRSASINSRLTNLDRELERLMKEAEYNLATPERESLGLNNILEELRYLRQRAIASLEEVASAPDSTLGQERAALLQNLQLRLDELNRTKADVVGDEFLQDLAGLRTQLQQSILQSTSLQQSDAIARVDGQIQNVEAAIARISRGNNVSALNSLSETRNRLLALRERLRNMPTKTNQLTPDEQQSWQATQIVRRRLERSSSDLQQNLQNYRNRVSKQVDEIRANQAKFDELASDLEVVQEDGLTLYEREKQSAVNSNQNLISNIYQEADQNLNQLRLLADPNVGIRYVMQNIPAVVEEGAIEVREGLAIPKKRPASRLDEAAQIRRNVIRQARNRIEYDAPEGKTSSAPVNRIEQLLDYDAPGRVTRERLQAVDEQIRQVIQLRDRTAFEMGRAATKTRESLEQLRSLDPVAYSEINPQRVIDEINYNAAFQAQGFEQRLQRLNRMRQRLQADLDTEISYELVPGQRLPTSQVRSAMQAIRTEVRNIGRTRRQDLDQVWRQVVSSGVDSRALEQRIKDNRDRRSSGVKGSYLTPAQQRLLSGLSDEQWQTLQDAVGSGAFDLYRDLGRLSGVKNNLEVTAVKLQQQIQKLTAEIQQKTGYQVTVRIDADGNLTTEVADVETNPDRFRRRRPSPESQLAKLRGLTGEALNRPPDLDNPKALREVQLAITRNQQQRGEIDVRLELLNFNQYLRLAEFRKSKLLGRRSKLLKSRNLLLR